MQEKIKLVFDSIYRKLSNAELAENVVSRMMSTLK